MLAIRRLGIDWEESVKKNRTIQPAEEHVSWDACVYVCSVVNLHLIFVAVEFVI